MCTSLTYPRPGWLPPKTTALFLSTVVNEKPEQGGGLDPVMGGDDQVPGNSEIVIYIHLLYYAWLTLFGGL